MPFSEQLVLIAEVFSVFLSTGLVTLLILLLATSLIGVCVLLLPLAFLVCMEVNWLLEVFEKIVLPLSHTFRETVFSFANTLMLEVGDGFPLEGGGLPMEGGGLPMEGGGLPMEGDGLPMEGGGLPMEGGGLPMEGGGLPMEGGGFPLEDGEAK